MAKLEDVAKLAGVSTATVSRVLNGVNNVSKKTIIKVKKAVEELNYRPSTQAKNLARVKKGFKINLLMSSRLEKFFGKQNKFGTKDFYETVVNGILDGAEDSNCKVNIFSYEKYLKQEEKEEVDGILLLGADSIPKEIENIQLPKVLIDNYIPGKKVNCVFSNGYDGAYYAISKMIKKGYKKIVHLHGSLEYYSFKSRYEGYLYAMKENNILPRTYESDETRENIANMINMILSQKPEIIFTSNDPMALILLEELKKKNIKVPEDIQVIGFDDIIYSNLSEPPLTTVKVFKYEMGNIAIIRLVDIISNKNTHPASVSLFTEFIERKTTL